MRLSWQQSSPALPPNVRAIQAVGVAPVSLSRHNVSIVAQSYAVATDSNTSTEPIRDEKPDNSSASTSSSIDDDDDRTVQVERYTEIVLDQGGRTKSRGYTGNYIWDVVLI